MDLDYVNNLLIDFFHAKFHHDGCRGAVCDPETGNLWMFEI